MTKYWQCLDGIEEVKRRGWKIFNGMKCFHCLLSPDGDDPIFIGIDRLVAKGLYNGTLQGKGVHYPCQVVNRFQCPFERNATSGKDVLFDADDLFRLHKLAFVIEISLAKAMKDDSDSLRLSFWIS